jgi:hypothetical protein
MSVTSDPGAQPALPERPRGLPPPPRGETRSETKGAAAQREERSATNRPHPFLVALLRALAPWCT